MKKTITLGITGAIGASNIIDYCIFLSVKYDINIIMTENAKKFISREVLNYYTKNVYSDYSDSLSSVLHADLAKNTDMFIIIPATANTISKIAHGIGDNLLTTTALIYTGKIFFAPNMNINIWKNKIVQNNVKLLKDYGHEFINTTKTSYALCERKFIEIDCALPTPKELLSIIEDYFNEGTHHEQ